MSKRKKPTLSERYAAVLLDLKFGDGRAVIDREAAKHMTPLEIIDSFESTIQFDHGVHASIGGSNHPTNLTPRHPSAHKVKTDKIDIPQIAKTKRIEKDQQEFRNRILAKSGLADTVANPASSSKSKSKLRSRPMAGTKASGMKKKLNGSVEKR